MDLKSIAERHKGSNPFTPTKCADGEMANTLGLGPSTSNGLRVQVPLCVPMRL